EPDLHDVFQDGLLLEEEGHINNRQLLDVLLTEIRSAGGECIEHCPVSLDAYTITTPTEQRTFDLVIDCRGMGAKSTANQLRGVRGETLHVETREISLQRPVRLMHPRYQLYIVPKPDHRFVIGATQIESEDRSPVTLQSSLELSSALYTVAPAFAEARILELGVNLDRKSTRLNSSHVKISYAVFCLKGNMTSLLYTLSLHDALPIYPRYQLYIVPKPDHRFVIGATQIESEDRSPVTLQSSLELSSALYTVAPAFAEARILELGVN